MEKNLENGPQTDWEVFLKKRHLQGISPLLHIFEIMEPFIARVSSGPSEKKV